MANINQQLSNLFLVYDKQIGTLANNVFIFLSGFKEYNYPTKLVFTIHSLKSGVLRGNLSKFFIQKEKDPKFVIEITSKLPYDESSINYSNCNWGVSVSVLTKEQICFIKLFKIKSEKLEERDKIITLKNQTVSYQLSDIENVGKEIEVMLFKVLSDLQNKRPELFN